MKISSLEYTQEELKDFKERIIVPCREKYNKLNYFLAPQIETKLINLVKEDDLEIRFYQTIFDKILEKIEGTRTEKLKIRETPIKVLVKRDSNNLSNLLISELANKKNYDKENTLDLSQYPDKKWDKSLAAVVNQINNAKEIIESKINKTPNRLLLSSLAFNALRSNKDMNESLRRGDRVTEETICYLFNLDQVEVSDFVLINDKWEKSYGWNNNALLFYNSTDVFTDPRTNLANLYVDDHKSFVPFESYDEEVGIFLVTIHVHSKLVRNQMGENGSIAAGYLFENVG